MVHGQKCIHLGSQYISHVMELKVLIDLSDLQQIITY